MTDVVWVQRQHSGQVAHVLGLRVGEAGGESVEDVLVDVVQNLLHHVLADERLGAIEQGIVVR